MGLKKNILYSGFLTTSLYIFQFITYPYVARVLEVTNIGICSYVQSIVQYFMLFSMMGVTSLGIREIASCGNDFKKRDIVFSKIFQLTSLTTLLVVLCYIACIELIPKLTVYRELLYVGVFQIIFNTLTIEWFFRGIEDFKYITIRTLIIRSIYVIAVFLFVQSPSDYDKYFILTTLTYVANGVINLLYSRKIVGFHWQRLVSLQCYIRPMLYLGILSILGAMYTSFNTIYLGFVTDDTEVGYYTTATKIQGIILGLYSAFTLVMMPRMSSCNDKKEKSHMIDVSHIFLLNLTIPIIIVSECFAEIIIRIISGPSYTAATPMLMITMPLLYIIGIRQIFVAQILIPNKEDRSILNCSVGGGITGLITSLLLVNLWKGLGSATVFIASETVVAILSYYYVRKKKLYSFDIKKTGYNLIYWIPFILFCLLLKEVENQYTGFLISCLSAFLYVHIVMMYIIKNAQYQLIIRKTFHLKKNK